MADRRCGTCSYFEIGQRGYCTWSPPEELNLPSSFHIMNMWIDDGKGCKTWEPEKSS